ncbi:MAG TPA: AMP-binding protein [bacterium]|nr:AMP-binding protein [bacterium]
MLNPKIELVDTIPQAYIEAAKVFKNRPSLRFRKTPDDPYSGTYSFQELVDIPKQIAAFLVDNFNVPINRNIGFISENRPEYTLGDIGVMCSNCVSWGLYDYDLKNSEMIDHKLNDSETEILFTSPQYLEIIRNILSAGKTPLKHIIVMGDDTKKIHYKSNEIPFTDILNESKSNSTLIDDRIADTKAGDTARLIYTSGTTGMPKGVMLSHYNLMSNVKSCSSLLKVEPRERLVAFLPEAHSFQGFITLATLLNGAEIWYSHKTTLLDDLQIIRPTLFTGVPLVYKKFAEGMRDKVLELTNGWMDLSADYSNRPVKSLLRRRIIGRRVLKKVGLDKVRRAVSGSAKLELAHAKTLENIGFIVQEGYGISETSPVISTERFDQRRSGSVGLPVPGVDVKILSMELDGDGKRYFLPPGTRGEIVVKGPNVFKGYFKDKKSTASSIVDGYYHTGDIGHLDSDGFLFVHGRTGLQVKMANGEFVDLDALGANIIKHTNLIQSVAVDAEMQDYSIAIVSLPWENEELQEIAEKVSVPFNGNPLEFSKNETVIKAIKDEIEENEKYFGNKKNPGTPKKYLIVKPMSPETGEITSTLKFRVRTILVKYHAQLQELRNSDQKFMVYIN